MQVRKSRAAGVALGALALLGLPATASRADDDVVLPATQAANALHLIETARYGEAISAVQALVDQAPNDPLAYQLRGTLELYFGSLPMAQQDFQAASGLMPDNPVTLYGQGLMQAWAGHLDMAQTDFTKISQIPDLPTSQTSDLTTALAYLQYLRGDLDGAKQTAGAAGAESDSTRQELLALIAAKIQPQEGTALLTDFLKTSTGIPRVQEAEGLRPLFQTSPTEIEPAVTEPPLQHLYTASLRDHRSQTTQRGKYARHLSGTVALQPQSTLSSQTTVVTFSVDGQLVGMVNSPPYHFSWQTEDETNGWHALRITALDANSEILSATEQRVYVENAHGSSSNAGLAANTDLETRVWNLLRLRPARKVAEWTLADLLQQQGDVVGAKTHRAIAAALDADYKDARQSAQASFDGPGAPNVHTAKAEKLSGLWVGPASGKRVALTFDDGPNPLKTPALLDALDKANAPATFFVVGSRAEAAPDLVRRMAARGDDVEDHSYTHPNMAQSAPAVAEAEILRTSVVIRSLTGKPPRFFRPPGGQRNPIVYQLAGEYGQTVALWTIDALNYEEGSSPQGLIDFIMKHMQPGAIVLMHNGMDGTITAIPGLVTALRAKGYQLVTLTQLTSPNPTVKAARLPKPQP